MSRRPTADRRADIVALVTANQRMTVETLSQQLGTSAVTIRKDLAALEQQGKLLRQFGAAIAKPVEATQNDQDRSGVKSCIAKAAASLIYDGMSVLIDSGSTTAALLPLLEEYKDLVVMTNSLQFAHQLTLLRNEPRILVTGGSWDAQSQSLQGRMAEQMLQAYSFDIAFVGASGIDPARGTTTYNELTGLSQAMARHADKVAVLAESRKLSHKMPNLELAWSEIDYLISDDRIDKSAAQQIQHQGAEVICAPCSGG